MHLLLSTLNKFLSLKNKKKFIKPKKFFSHKDLSKYFNIHKDDIGQIFSKLKWIEHSNDYIVITKEGEEHCAAKHLLEEIKEEKEIMWKETLLRNEIFIREVNALINNFSTYKIS